MRTISLLLAAGLLGATMGSATKARACPGACFHPLRTFANGASVPGNQVYFKLLVDDPGELSLKTADGRAIAASIRMIGPDRVYAPLEPIPSDTLVVLTYPSDTCGSGAPPATYTFSTRAPLDLALQSAQLVPGEYGLLAALPDLNTDTSNSNAGPIAFQRLGLTSLDATGATSHLSDFDLSVDGHSAAVGLARWDSPIELHAVCTTSDPIPQPIGTCVERIFGPGHHVVTVQPHIVGYADPPSIDAEVDFDRACALNRAAPPMAASPDAGASDAGSSASSLAHSRGDASLTSAAGTSSRPASGQAVAPPRAASGCSAAARSAADRPAWPVLLALSAFVVSARRRHSRANSALMRKVARRERCCGPIRGPSAHVVLVQGTGPFRAK